jgi:molybdate transport system substrate-binding protein
MRPPSPAGSVLLACLAFASCTATSATGPDRTKGGEVTVFAASSLTQAFSKLGAVFEKLHPGSKARFNFAASDTLATQINQGAPADVFAAAGSVPVEAIATSSLRRVPRVFASNKLLIIIPKSNPALLSKPQDVATRGVKLVLAAPGVPAGDYARQALNNLGIRKRAEMNVVSNEVDDKSVVSKVVLGEVDAGIVYVSDLTPDVASKVASIPIPKRDNVVARYLIVALDVGPNLEGGREFVRLVLSPRGQRTLQGFGFGPP